VLAFIAEQEKTLETQPATSLSGEADRSAA
jgi:hypothetical protein